jgi:abequosyltransferase
MDNNIKMPLLSICIPTWNRAKFLAQSLGRFAEQIKDISPEELELYVSDNCSDDNTSEVVTYYIDTGLPITYNIKKCFSLIYHLAKG